MEVQTKEGRAELLQRVTALLLDAVCCDDEREAIVREVAELSVLFDAASRGMRYPSILLAAQALMTRVCDAMDAEG